MVKVSNPADAVEQFIEKYEPQPWDREALRALLEEALFAETGRASFWKLALDLMERIKKDGEDESEIDQAIAKALGEAENSTP